MKKKKKGIPVESMFLSPHFKRNYEIRMRENRKAHDPFLAAITDELVRNASERVQQKQGSSKAGIKSGVQRKKTATEKHKSMIEAARKLLAQGKPRRGLAGRLAQRFKNVTIRQINNILKDADL